MAKLRLTPIAEDDLAAIWAYIAGDNPRAADRMYSKLYSTAEKLAEFPGLGARRDDLIVGFAHFQWESTLLDIVLSMTPWKFYASSTACASLI